MKKKPPVKRKKKPEPDPRLTALRDQCIKDRELVYKLTANIGTVAQKVSEHNIIVLRLSDRISALEARVQPVNAVATSRQTK